MDFNFLPIIASTFVTLLVGFAWYHPKVFGTAWMKETGMTEEKAQQGNMMKIFGLTIVYSFLLAFMTQFLVVHEYGAFGMVEGNVNDPQYLEFMKAHAGKFRSYKHGMLHGIMAGLFFALPLVAINGLFEQKSWKYIAINAGYWIVSLAIMGAIICGWQ
jgi:Protein of unknown function (DUF1761)